MTKFEILPKLLQIVPSLSTDGHQTYHGHTDQCSAKKGKELAVTGPVQSADPSGQP